MLPKEFETRMHGLLGDEADRFFAALNEQDSVHALRVNREKITADAFRAVFPCELTPLPYTPDGFIVSGEKLGNTPFHHAGMMYLQDPAAMSTLCALEIGRGWRVLDTCASPGGKTTQAAACVGHEGYVVANEYVAGRAQVLAGNVERMGLRNVTVTNVDTSVLADWYPSYFDLVVTDAPCSGEGMFRKNAEAISEWSEDNVHLCAERQKEILANAVRCVAPGGYLLYSTCTYAREENEENVAWVLWKCPEFSLVPVAEALRDATADGIPVDGCEADMTLTRRFYPHRAPGEGQFIALLRRTGDGKTLEKPAFRETAKPLSREESAVVEAFLCDTLGKSPEDRRLVRYRDTVYSVPENGTVPPFGVISAGVPVGEIVKGRVVPHHGFFMAFGNKFLRRVTLSREDARVGQYLHGNVIPAPDCGDGWAAVLFEGCTLGGCKVVSGTAKNHYPKGLRIP